MEISRNGTGLSFCFFESMQHTRNCHEALVLASASFLLLALQPSETRGFATIYIDASKRVVPSANIRSGVMRLTTR